LRESDEFSARIAISVSKKKFKRAVDRNRIKRIVKENYRLEKEILYQKYTDTSKQIDMLIIYTETKILPFSFVQKKIIELLNRIK
jgi:ribonuclease P protein component